VADGSASVRAPAAITLHISPFPISTLSARVEMAVLRGLHASKTSVDGGVDGVTSDGIALQVTVTRRVGRQKLDLMVRGMQRHGLSDGWLIAPSFGAGIGPEISRLRLLGVTVTPVMLQLSWQGGINGS
jgi:hypothetical protein